jgi:predicted nucleic acid-binding Zn ribbon protein
MPIYPFECKVCGFYKEVFASIHDTKEHMRQICNNCWDGITTSGAPLMTRVFTVGTSMVYKSLGSYIERNAVRQPKEWFADERRKLQDKNERRDREIQDEM